MFCYHLESKLLAALLAGALIKLKIKAKSWLNWQIPILTEGEHSKCKNYKYECKKN